MFRQFSRILFSPRVHGVEGEEENAIYANNGGTYQRTRFHFRLIHFIFICIPKDIRFYSKDRQVAPNFRPVLFGDLILTLDINVKKNTGATYPRATLDSVRPTRGIPTYARSLKQKSGV